MIESKPTGCKPAKSPGSRPICIKFCQKKVYINIFLYSFAATFGWKFCVSSHILFSQALVPALPHPMEHDIICEQSITAKYCKIKFIFLTVSKGAYIL